MVRWAELTQQQQQQFGNGCGTAFFPEWLTKLLFGWFFETSCRRHDFGYARGGSKQDRRYVDHGFYLAMKRDAARLNGINHYLALIVAWFFYVSVRLFGSFCFRYSSYLTKAQILDQAE